MTLAIFGTQLIGKQPYGSLARMDQLDQHCDDATGTSRMAMLCQIVRHNFLFLSGNM